jgi:hypothetical protein
VATEKNNLVTKNDIIKIRNDNDTYTFYKCIGGSREGFAEFVELTSATNLYAQNYAIDAEYGEGRGYDSTVWQKVYSNNSAKYVMIAELNSVVPTFDITTDAPTENPKAPYFDVDSTNDYYKLHV